MKSNRNNHLSLMIKLLLVGIFIAGLIYLLHPETRYLSIMVNGEPIAEPLAKFAAIPTLFVVILFIGILALLTFMGVSLMLFIGASLFVMLGLVVIAPYAWPLILITFLLIALMSFNKN